MASKSKAKKKALKLTPIAPPSFPKPIYDEHNNPVWEMKLPVMVHRMDNSITMGEHWGTLTDKKTDKKIGSISMAYGGFVAVVHLEGGIRFALDINRAILQVVEDQAVYALAKKKALRRKKQ